MLRRSVLKGGLSLFHPAPSLCTPYRFFTESLSPSQLRPPHVSASLPSPSATSPLPSPPQWNLLSLNLFSAPQYRRVKSSSPRVGRPKESELVEENETDDDTSVEDHEDENALSTTNSNVVDPIDITDVTIVTTLDGALSALDMLMSPSLSSPSRFHAVDTESTDIDLSTQSPIGNGKVVCFSIYCGNDVNFGNGPRLWVDCLDCVDANGKQFDVFALFKPYFEAPHIKKIFHNYSYDRHVLANHGVKVKGFAYDTMVMARLWDTARGFYSLESLSAELLGRAKTAMSKRFSKFKLKKDGTVGKAKELPPIHEIQRDAVQRSAWIDYSTYDTEATWGVFVSLSEKLKNLPWINNKTMLDFYEEYYRPFGEMLANMEERGVRIRAEDHLQTIEKKAEEDKVRYMDGFLQWAKSLHATNQYMNLSSTVQKQHFFFGNGLKEFERDNVEGVIDPFDQLRYEEAMVKYQSDLREFEERRKQPKFPARAKPPSPPKPPKAKKMTSFTISGLGLPAIKKTKTSKLPAVSLPVLKELGGDPFNDPPKYGPAFRPLGGGERGIAGCRAIAHLCEISAVNMMLQTFIKPLQTSLDSNSRVHCSLGLNTETGRLSSRKPNLQNQPAVEKDKYRVRDAFVPADGCNFIVADYGQLELRILAHITQCQSMIDAFKLGGDFHSRTAITMYPHIQKAIDNGEVLVEWDSKSTGKPSPLPLVKDRFSIERKYAKILNFSVAYGKTAAGLAKDFGKSKVEAEEIVAKWYSARPEVKKWQEETIMEARHSGYVRTLMGRYRPLYDINKGVGHAESERIYKFERLHMERAAINTPIQGSAADIVMKAMLKIEEHRRLQEIKWRVLLQIHDELICEGPEEHTDEAMKIIIDCMMNPFQQSLLVDLTVDAKAGKSWFQAKG